ncbi:MAG: hypothetical protein KDK70_11730, partial [Myxococcales bacterium]|nr:hypothetical protein [Myxococcales bacterium]
MLRTRALLAATMLVLSACNCGKEGETPAADGAAAQAEAASAVPRDQTVLATVAALGHEGALVLVLRPQQWTALHQALDAWLARLPDAEPLRAIQRAKEAKDLPGMLATLAGLPPGPVALDGWDPTRPIVASVGEVPYDGVPGSVTPNLPLLDGWVPPVRHQVVVPASDPTTLVGSLAAVLQGRGEPWPALVSGREGARAVQLDGTTVVALLPETGAVRAVIFQSAVMPDEAARLEHMRSRLEAEPAEPTATPALSLLGQPDAVAAGWVRPWRLRPLSAWAGGVQVLRALATVSSAQRTPLMARGLQILLGTELLMTDEGSELDDLAMTLTVDDGVLRLRSASRTPWR